MNTIRVSSNLIRISALILYFFVIQISSAQDGGNAIDIYNENYLAHGDFIDLGSPDYGFADKVTVCAWVKWNVNPQNYTNNHNEQEGRNADIVTIDKHNIKDNGQFWLQHSNSNNYFQWVVQTNSSRKSITSSTSPSNNTWYYLVGVYDDSDPTKSMKIYVNGVLENSDNTLSGNINPYNALHRLNIGRLPSGYRLFAGELDEIRIYKRALTQQEIKEQMFSALTIDTTSLLSYWNFNQSSGTTVPDQGSMQVNGTFYSALVDVHDTDSSPVYTIYDNDKSWAVNEWAGKQIVTVAGDGVGETNTVLSNDIYSLVLQNPWITKPRLDDLGAGTGMTWYGIIDPDETTQWKKSTASMGSEVRVVITQEPLVAGVNGASIQTTITSTPNTANNLAVYIYGSASGAPVTTGETFPAGVDRRSNIVWGSYEWGNVTSDIIIDFSGVAGILNTADLKLLKRNRFSTIWTEATTAVLDQNNMTFTLTGVTAYYEFSIGGNSGNPLPVLLAEFNAASVDNSVTLFWRTLAEINNSGFEIERKSIENGAAEKWNKLGFVPGHGTTSEEQHYSYSDKGLSKGIFSYRLKQIDLNGNYEYFYLANSINIKSPVNTELFQNYPNPSNPASKIDFRLSADGYVSLIVYDITGREVRILVNGLLESGYHTAEFNGSDLASGIYFYKFAVKSEGYEYSSVKRIVLIK